MSEYNIQMNKYNALNANYDQLYPQPMKHASTHAKNGSDPITPSMIGTYNKTEIDTALQNKADASSVYTKSESDTLLATKIDASSGAGGHNSIYRGKYLGDSVTAEQYAAINDGTFNGLYIGDYWTIGGINYRIAAFDYYYNTGDPFCTTHHVTLVPDSNLYGYAMNDTNTTNGAYVNSKMYKTGLTQAKTTINTAFGSAHILNHGQFLPNATNNGYESGSSWYDSTVELMTEHNVYGGKIFKNATQGTGLAYSFTLDKSQYSLFAFRPDLITNGGTYWLRDVASNSVFAAVYSEGQAGTRGASDVVGVRPAFSIKA